MYSAPRIACKYLHYYFTAFNGKGHGTHSPFIFRFIREVLTDKKPYPAYTKVETLRKQLLDDQTVLQVEDMGAGSARHASHNRSVSSIAKHAVKPRKFGQLLYRMANVYKPATILELGTSLGLSASYLSLGHPAARVITMEGAPAIAAKAKHNFNSLQLENVEMVEGNFDTTLPAVLEKFPELDLVFIDGNHRREPTERYFQQLLPHLHNDSILIFDDIHWSREMEDAWKSIKLHPSVTCSVDLFFIGLIFFRKEFLEKQHFTIRF